MGFVYRDVSLDSARLIGKIKTTISIRDGGGGGDEWWSDDERHEYAMARGRDEFAR